MSEHGADPDVHTIEFLHADHQRSLDLAEHSFDLLISRYAGFVSEHCTRYLRIGRHLLVNSSHGDAAMASIDPRHGLKAVVTTGEPHRVSSANLDSYLVPKRDVGVTKEHLHRTGHGIAYTRSPFASLFERRA